MNTRHCDHSMYIVPGTNNFRCHYCEYAVNWGYMHEKQYIDNIARSERTDKEKRKILNGLTVAYKTYESKNTSTEEDVKLIKYIKKTVQEL